MLTQRVVYFYFLFSKLNELNWSKKACHTWPPNPTQDFKSYFQIPIGPSHMLAPSHHFLGISFPLMTPPHNHEKNWMHHFYLFVQQDNIRVKLSLKIL